MKVVEGDGGGFKKTTAHAATAGCGQGGVPTRQPANSAHVGPREKDRYVRDVRSCTWHHRWCLQHECIRNIGIASRDFVDLVTPGHACHPCSVSSFAPRPDSDGDGNLGLVGRPSDHGGTRRLRRHDATRPRWVRPREPRRGAAHTTTNRATPCDRHVRVSLPTSMLRHLGECDFAPDPD